MPKQRYDGTAAPPTSNLRPERMPRRLQSPAYLALGRIFAATKAKSGTARSFGFLNSADAAMAFGPASRPDTTDDVEHVIWKTVRMWTNFNVLSNDGRRWPPLLFAVSKCTRKIAAAPLLNVLGSLYKVSFHYFGQIENKFPIDPQ